MDKGNESTTEYLADETCANAENSGGHNVFSAFFSLFNARPLLSGALGMAVGIVSVYFSVASGFLSVFVCLIFALAAAFIGILFANDKNKKRCAVIFAAFALFGVIRSEAELFSFANCKNYGGDVTVVAKVESVFCGDGYVRLELSGAAAGGERLRGNAYIYAYKEDFYGVLPSKCDEITFKTNLSRTADNSDSDVKKRYYSLGVYYTGNALSKIKITGKRQNVFEKCSFYVAGYLKHAVSEENYGIVLAMILGDSSRLSDETMNAFRLSGLAHVFAVSGLHIGLFSGLFVFLAERVKLKRYKKCFFVLVPTLFYVGICGFSSSAVRAFTMLAAVMLAELFGFKNDRLSALSGAAIVISVVSPSEIFSKGWQLSFAALAGIVLLCPLLKRGTAPLKQNVGEAVSVCLAAQLGTLPILTDMCGYMSIIAPFANLIALPVISLIYRILAVSCVLGISFYAFGAGDTVLKIITFLPDNALSAISAAITAVNYDKLILPFSFGTAVLPYCLAVLTVSDVTNLPVKSKIKTFLAFCIAFVACLP